MKFIDVLIINCWCTEGLHQRETSMADNYPRKEDKDSCYSMDIYISEK